jgi:capsular polysaccharide biosynthesis protein
MKGFFNRIFWQPGGCVASLDNLETAHGMIGKVDLTSALRGVDARPDNNPLLVAELAGGKIIGDLRLASTRDDAAIGGVQTVFACDDLPNHYALRRRRVRVPKFRPGKALLLGAANSDNYFHWLLESVPRWKMLQAARHLEYDNVLLHSRPASFQDEILDRIGVLPTKRLRCGKGFAHQFERLVVPAMPFPLWQTAPWACEFVRSLFPERGGGPEKIYLSRRGAARRRLVNEAGLEAALEARGFVCVRPEKLSVAAQAKMFGSVKCVVSPHGAGLANLVFTPPGALVVELLHPDNHNPTYQNLAAACGLRYAGLAGRRTRELPHHDDDRAEYEIEVAEVLRLLAENV